MLQHLGWGVSRLTWRQRHPRLTRVIACILLLFLAFEVGIRLIPPNGVTMKEVAYPPESKPITTSFHSTDSAKVRYWHNALSGRPRVNIMTYASFFLRPHRMCVSPPIDGPQNTTTFTFTYDGIPVESFTGEQGTSCGVFLESSGGVPDILLLYSNRPWQQYSAPVTP